MLAKRRRLSAIEVREVIKKGSFRRAAYTTMKYVPAAAPLRAAAVVSKKVAKSAVERNRLRRALYRALQPRAGGGKAVIFVQKTPGDPLVTAFAADLDILLR